MDRRMREGLDPWEDQHQQLQPERHAQRPERPDPQVGQPQETPPPQGDGHQGQDDDRDEQHPSSKVGGIPFPIGSERGPLEIQT